MDAADAEQLRALTAVAAVAGWQDRSPTFETAFPVLASPGWHGVDGLHWRVTDPASGARLHVKAMHADAAHYIDVETSIAAARAASALGIGPRVLAADPATGTLVMECLDGWRAGTLDRLHDPAIRAGIIAARRAFHTTAKLPRTVGVFEDIARFATAARAHPARLPADIDWLLDNARDAGDAIAATGFDLVPAHGDGTASNVLIGPDGGVRLVDWDRAGNMDPFADLGSFLVEACAQEPEARAVFIEWHGKPDEKLFNRAMLYGVADDLRWGLIGALLAAVSTRPTLEFLKYANWRFLRCRMAMRDPRFTERCRSL
jgi:hypothetical protein